MACDQRCYSAGGQRCVITSHSQVTRGALFKMIMSSFAGDQRCSSAGDLLFLKIRGVLVMMNRCSFAGVRGANWQVMMCSFAGDQRCSLAGNRSCCAAGY